MLQTLEDFHRNISAGIGAIRAHCEAATPDTAGLGSARVKLSRVSAARSRFVAETVIPHLLNDADPALRKELMDLQRGFNAKRLASSEHVTTWTSQAIAADWTGYRKAARQIWAMMEEQMRRERTTLGERLRRSGG
jgi:hypothetical protein